MTSKQYEELCRYFLGTQLGVPVGSVQSGVLPGSKRPSSPELLHQIDLFWTTGDTVCEYFNIANAKWRGTAKVKQGEVLLLQQVREELRAHKAVMITNSDFTAGAKSVAREKGIALHVVRPTFDYSNLDPKDGTAILQKIQQIAQSQSGPVLTSEVVHRAFDLAGPETQTVSPPGPPPAGGRSDSTRIATAHSNRALTGGSNRIIGQGGNRGSHAQQGGSVTRGGGGPGSRTKQS